MEQTTQQITQKPSLPIKTKIAAWWMIIVGGILLIQIARAVWALSDALYLYFEFIAENLFCALMIFIPSILILLKRKAGWWISRIFLWVTLIIGVILFIDFFIINIPLGMGVRFALEGITIESIDMLVPVTLSLKLIKLGVPTLIIQLVTHIIPLTIILIPIILFELDCKNFNRIVKETSLPFKTEVARLLLGINLILLLIYPIFYLWEKDYNAAFWSVIFSILILAIFILYQKRKKRALKISIPIFCLSLAFNILLLIQNNTEYLLSFLLAFPAFILIILDRKNYLQIAS